MVTVLLSKSNGGKCVLLVPVGLMSSSLRLGPGAVTRKEKIL